MNQATLFVIVGPAGTGKTTVVDRLRQDVPDAVFPISCTTRPPRAGEVDGKDYHFLSETLFADAVSEEAMIGVATIHGNQYGVCKNDLLGPLDRGQSVVRILDVQGADEIKQLLPSAYVIFLAAPLDVLKQRLTARGDADIDTRLATAAQELARQNDYDALFDAAFPLDSPDWTEQYQAICTLIASSITPGEMAA